MRRRLLASDSTARHEPYPWDYRLDYLQTSKTHGQYIDTGLKASDAYDGLHFSGGVLFNGTNFGTGWAPYLFGGYGADAAGLIFSTNERYQWMLRWGPNAGNKYTFTGSYALNKRYLCEAHFSPDISWWNVDGRRLHTAYNCGPFASVMLPLFCVWNIDAVLLRENWQNMYGPWRFRIGDRLVREFIPCVKDGIVCIYDTVERRFHYNLGSGEFSPGNRVDDDWESDSEEE